MFDTPALDSLCGLDCNHRESFCCIASSSPCLLSFDNRLYQGLPQGQNLVQGPVWIFSFKKLLHYSHGYLFPALLLLCHVAKSQLIKAIRYPLPPSGTKDNTFLLHQWTRRRAAGTGLLDFWGSGSTKLSWSPLIPVLFQYWDWRASQLNRIEWRLQWEQLSVESKEALACFRPRHKTQVACVPTRNITSTKCVCVFTSVSEGTWSLGRFISCEAMVPVTEFPLRLVFLEANRGLPFDDPEHLIPPNPSWQNKIGPFDEVML